LHDIQKTIKSMTDILVQASELIKQNKPAALCTIVETGGSTPRKANSRMLVFPDGTISGTIGGGSVEKEVIETALKVLKTNKSELLKCNLKQDYEMECGGSMKVFIEALAVMPELLIFGGGHIGKALSSFASSVGFAVTVIDDRDGIFNSYQAGSIKTVNIGYNDFINNYDFSDNTYIVVVTHQHKNDYEVLSKVCTKPHAYLGMIGSKIKVAQATKTLLEEKVLSEEIIKLIDMPIGIPIKCETPEEIAISILAKIIDIKNQNSK